MYLHLHRRPLSHRLLRLPLRLHHHCSHHQRRALPRL